MAVKIRLRRMGQKKAPIYRIIVADSRSPRDGRCIDEIGTYNPNTDPVLADYKFAEGYIQVDGAVTEPTTTSTTQITTTTAAPTTTTTAAPTTTTTAASTTTTVSSAVSTTTTVAESSTAADSTSTTKAQSTTTKKGSGKSSDSPKTGVTGVGVAVAGLAVAVGTAFALKKKED
mgnify:CR=1 FL=1